MTYDWQSILQFFGISTDDRHFKRKETQKNRCPILHRPGSLPGYYSLVLLRSDKNDLEIMPFIVHLKLLKVFRGNTKGDLFYGKQKKAT